MEKPTISSRASKLYYFYSISERIGNWFWNRIRPAGIAAFLAVILSGAMAFGQPKNSLLQLFCVSLSLILCAAIWLIFRRGKVRISTEVMDFSDLGELIEYRVVAINEGKRRLKSAAIIPADMDTIPPLHAFLNQREPEEENRNLFDRNMAFFRWKWLQRKYRKNAAINRPIFQTLLPGERKTFRFQFTAAQRGLHDRSEYFLILPEPIGLFQRCRKLKSEPALITVLPKRYLVEEINFDHAMSAEISSETSSSSAGNSGDLLGLRDYRAGDSVRAIDWKSWAKTGKPFVKEVEDLTHSQHHLYLDLACGNISETTFEAMLSIATSFALPIHSNTKSPRSIWLGVRHFQSAENIGFEDHSELLKCLADATLSKVDQTKNKIASIQENTARNDLIVLILADENSENLSLIHALEETGFPVFPIFVYSTKKPIHSGHTVSADTIETDLSLLSSHNSSGE